MVKSEEIQNSLERLKKASPEIEGIALVSQDGFIVASILPEPQEEERVAALSAAFLGLAERCAEELGKGLPRQLFLQTEAGYIILKTVGRDTCLSVLSSRFGKPGMLLLDVKRTAEELLPLL